MELHRQAVPKIVALAKSFENVDMILVSCADDPQPYPRSKKTPFSES